MRASGDIDDVLGTLDWYAYHKSLLINIGDVKGRLLDAAVNRSDPKVVLELGTYCGYSALRIAREAPSAHVYSVELSAENAELARRVWDHAGVGDRITCVVGTLADGGHTIGQLDAAIGESPGGTVDFVFIDHDKRSYVDRSVGHHRKRLAAPRIHRGSRQRRLSRCAALSPLHAAQGRRAVANPRHRAHAEYQSLIPDLVLESEFLGG